MLGLQVNHCPFFDLARWLISSSSTHHFKYFEHFKECSHYDRILDTDPVL